MSTPTQTHQSLTICYGYSKLGSDVNTDIPTPIKGDGKDMLLT